MVAIRALVSYFTVCPTNVPFFSTKRSRYVSFSKLQNVCISLNASYSYPFLTSNFLFSPDGGISIHWLTDFPGNSTIMVFTSCASDGTFAFLTDNQEVSFVVNMYNFAKSEN